MTMTITSVEDMREAIKRSAEYHEIIRCRLDGITEESALLTIRVLTAEADSTETEIGGAPATDVWGVTSDGREFRLFLL
jgi:hypothetical protein